MDSQAQVVKAIADKAQKGVIWVAEIVATNEALGSVDVAIRSSGAVLRAVPILEQVDMSSLQVGRSCIIALDLDAKQYLCLGSFASGGRAKLSRVANHQHTATLGDGGVLNDWTEFNVTCTYASAITFTVTDDFDNIFVAGTVLRCKQGGDYLYFKVVSSVYSDPDTTVTLLGVRSTDVLANATITDVAYSTVVPKDVPLLDAGSSNAVCVNGVAEVSTTNTSLTTTGYAVTVTAAAGDNVQVIATLERKVNNGSGRWQIETGGTLVGYAAGGSNTGYVATALVVVDQAVSAGSHTYTLYQEQLESGSGWAAYVRKVTLTATVITPS